MGLFGSDDGGPVDVSGDEIGKLSSQGNHPPDALGRVVDEEAGVVLYYALSNEVAGTTAVPLDQTDLDPSELDEDEPE